MVKEKEVRHLHKTNDLAYCGIDISHVLATFDAKETTCEVCLAKLGEHYTELEGQIKGHHETLGQLDNHLEEAKTKVAEAQEDVIKLQDQLLRRKAELDQAIMTRSSLEQQHGNITNTINEHQTTLEGLPKAR